MSVSRIVFGLYISILSGVRFVVILISLLMSPLFLMKYYPYGTNSLQFAFTMSPISLPYFAVS